MTARPLTPGEARRVKTCPECEHAWAHHGLNAGRCWGCNMFLTEPCTRPDESLTKVAALVAEREAAAWDEGWQAGASRRVSTSNPYREATRGDAMTAAAEIREAAMLLRAAAQEARRVWITNVRTSSLEDQPRTDSGGQHPYIALMRPDVGLALADWLDAESHRPEEGIGHGITVGGPSLDALRVARRILRATP